MYLPSMFSSKAFDDFIDFPFQHSESGYQRDRFPVMRTDIKETEEGYELYIELPGYKKDEIDIRIEKGNLSISALRNEDKEDAVEEGGKYIRRERFHGSMKRTYYVGEDITVHDIKAKYSGGVLGLFIPKKPRAAVEAAQKVAIE